MNNPEITLEEFMVVLKSIPNMIAARCQLEKGEAGTPHFQWMISTKSQCQITSIIKKLKGCHVEVARNAMAAWDYCGKQDTRMEGPLDFGIPPAAKNVKGDTAKKNKLLIEQGIAESVDRGDCRLMDIAKLMKSKQIYNLLKNPAPKFH